MIKLINKVLSDTLKNNDNKFSSKKIMSFGAYNSAMSMIWLAFLFSLRFKTSYDILLLLFGIAGFSSVLSLLATGANKIIDNKAEMPVTVTNTTTTIEKKEVE